MSASALPTGTVTFLFTDIEGSTRLAHALTDEGWAALLHEHNRILRAVWTDHAGVEVSTAGDSFFVAFASAERAIAAAVAGQRALVEHQWPTAPPVRVRMGIHTGEALVRDHDYVGLHVHAAARVAAAAHGGQILVTEACRDAATREGRAGTGWLDLGLYALKDLPGELRLYQVVAERLDQRFDPVRSLAVFNNNVPVPASAFVGREHERARLHELIGSARLVSLIGPGGAGKTRLATEIALDRLDRHPDGVWMLELDGVDAGGVEHVFAPYAGRGERDLLLVVDNCEHVIAEAAASVERMLEASPRLRILATSREPLGVRGEVSLTLAPLPVTDEHSDAVALFLQRVQAVRSDALTRPQALATAVRVCRQLDGLPLAIGLAAARVRAMSIEQLEARLDLRLLSSGARTAAPRQQTLRGAIAWSYDLLDAGEREMFERISVFVGDFDIDAVEHIVDSGDPFDVLDRVTSLVEKSLVTITPAGRYHMLRTIRAYAADRLAERGTVATTRTRHASWIAARLDHDEARHGLTITTTNHDDVLAALEWSFSEDPPGAARMVRSALRLWVPEMRWADAMQYVDRALTVEGTDETTQFRLLQQGCAAGIYAGEFERAQRYAHDALERSRAAGDQAVEVASMRNLGIIAYNQGDLESAEALLAGALGGEGGPADIAEAAKAATHLAVIAHQRGESPVAQQRADTALAYAREAGVDECVPVLLNLLGVLASERGDTSTAKRHYHDALDLARDAGDQRAMVFLLYCLGSLALDEGDHGRAAAQLREAVDLGVRAASPLDLAESLEAAARLALALGDPATGAALLGAVDVMRERLAFPRGATAGAAHEQLVRELSDALGPVEFSNHAGRGRQLDDARAIDIATATLDRAANP